MRVLGDVVWSQDGDDGVASDQLASCRTGSPWAEESGSVRRQHLGPCASLFTKSGSSGGRGGGVEDGTRGPKENGE